MDLSCVMLAGSKRVQSQSWVSQLLTETSVCFTMLQGGWLMCLKSWHLFPVDLGHPGVKVNRWHIRFTSPFEMSAMLSGSSWILPSFNMNSYIEVMHSWVLLPRLLLLKLEVQQFCKNFKCIKTIHVVSWMWCCTGAWEHWVQNPVLLKALSVLHKSWGPSALDFSQG